MMATSWLSWCDAVLSEVGSNVSLESTPRRHGLTRGGTVTTSFDRPHRRSGQPTPSPDDPVTIDCDSCVMRHVACHDCVVTVLLGAPPSLDAEEQRALGVLADSGLVPPLRLVSTRVSDRAEATDHSDEATLPWSREAGGYRQRPGAAAG